MPPILQAPERVSAYGPHSPDPCCGRSPLRAAVQACPPVSTVFRPPMSAGVRGCLCCRHFEIGYILATVAMFWSARRSLKSA